MPAHQQCASLSPGICASSHNRLHASGKKRSVEIIYSEPVGNSIFNFLIRHGTGDVIKTFTANVLRSRSRFRNLSSHAIQVPELFESNVLGASFDFAFTQSTTGIVISCNRFQLRIEIGEVKNIHEKFRQLKRYTLLVVCIHYAAQKLSKRSE